MLKKFLSLALVLCLALSLTAFSAAEEGAAQDLVNIQVLFTSDIHGAIVDSAYSSGDAETVQGTSLAKLATLIRQYRAEQPNTILIDNGDSIQGTPFTYYFAFNRHDIQDPVMRAFRLLHYDVWTLGNHEFNYGLDILKKEIADASAPATDDQGSVTVLTANLVKRGSEAFEPWYNAYTVLEFDGVKVGSLRYVNVLRHARGDVAIAKL